MHTPTALWNDTNGSAHKKVGLLKEQLELEKIKQNGKTRYTLKRIEDQLSFDKGFYVFIRAIQLLKQSNDGVILVGLAGPSGSGKTAFSAKVKGLIPGVEVISMDNYNDGSKVIDDNFDDPRLTDYETLLKTLADLKADKETQVPIYDYKTSSRSGYNTVKPPASRVVILEGIYALNDRLRPLLDLRVSITGGVHFDLVKRVMRDVTRSGQGPEEIVQQITNTVYPMYKAFIEPDLLKAQLRIVNSFNPFSGFMNATYILKSRIVPSAEDAIAALEAPVEHLVEEDIYDIYLLPPAEDPETCQSWLRMRNVSGRYSLMFEEWVSEGPFIISPRIVFEVNVRILSGLMALGYHIGAVMRRKSEVFEGADGCSVQLDEVENLGKFVQVKGKDRTRVAELGKALGLDGTYIPRSYIEQVQLDKLTSDFKTVTEEWKRRFTLNGEPLFSDDLSQSSPGVPSRLLLRANTMPHGFCSAPASPHASISRQASRSCLQDLSSQYIAAHDIPQSNGGHGLPHRADGDDRFISNLKAHSPDEGLSAPGYTRYQEPLSVLADHVVRTSNLQQQVETMMVQHRATTEQLQKLAAATTQLTAAIVELRSTSPPAASSPTSALVMTVAITAFAAAAGAAAGCLLVRAAKQS